MYIYTILTLIESCSFGLTNIKYFLKYLAYIELFIRGIKSSVVFGGGGEVKLHFKLWAGSSENFLKNSKATSIY